MNQNNDKKGAVMSHDRHKPTSFLKRGLVYLLIANCCNPFWAMANPADPKVIHGQATFITNGNQLNITNTAGTVIDWGSFSIDSNEVTRFNQQNASSVVLNRITGQDPSKILGALQSNGKVVIINPNGILFGQNARVDVNGLTASSLNISNQDALANKWNFEGSSSAGKVQNDGSITTPSGGQVYLIAPNVENNGLITTPEGQVILAAGHKVQLIDSNDPAVQVVVSASDNQAVNLGRILAQSGSVGIYGGLINQRGTVNANSAVVGENGKIVFKAGDTTLLEAGSVTTATGAGKGGDIHILGDKVGLVGDASVDASGTQSGGTVLVGGDYHGDNAAIQNAKRTFFGSDASIKANAIESGDGGKVVVWADESTKAYGTISALGGTQFGDGGFVETSGKNTLAFHARVNVGASKGKGGTLLLDPATITLIGGTGDGAGDNATTFQGDSTPGTVLFGDSDISYFNESDIYQSELEGMAPGTNIVLEATDMIYAYGEFNFGQLILQDNVNLTLRTRNASTDGNSSLGIDLLSYVWNGLNVVAKGTGTITMQTGTGSNPQSANIVTSAIQSQGGAISIDASGSVSTGPISASPPSGVTGGNITINAGNYIFVNGGLDTRPGFSGTSGDITLNAGSYLSTGVGSVTYARNLVLLAADGIHSSNSSIGASVDGSFESSVDFLSARNTTSGDIRIGNTGDLTVKDLTTLGFGIKQLGSGDVLLSSDGSLTLQNSVSTTGGEIDLTSAKLLIQNTVSAGPGVVFLGGSTGESFDLGSATDAAASTIELSNTELDFITAEVLKIGSGGGINVSTSIAPANVNQLTLLSQGAITHSAGAKVTTSFLDIWGHNGVVLDTVTPVMSVINSGGSNPITINNSGALTVQSLTQTDGSTGSITLNNDNDLLVANAHTTSGSLSLSAQHALTVDVYGTVTAGTGAITLSAGSTGSVNDKLTLDNFSEVTSAGTVTLNAGDAIILAGGNVVSVGATQNANLNASLAPSLSSCISNPSLSGCSSVLPSLATCAVSPSTSGCSAVLPSLADCTVTPSLTGCSVVLPTIASCVATPNLAGCVAVLPSLNTCTINPALAGCSAVLPSLSTCISAPSSAGCSAVLPSIAACTVTPSLSGCSAVLPSLASCNTNPTLPGCSTVLPSISSCIATPFLPGCTVVLPTLAACSVNPGLAGCTVVLPSLAACTAAPNLTGCAVVLPGIAACTVNPTQAGCSAVLPSIANCSANPTLAGCSVVLPSLNACIVSPTTIGCSVVLPALAVCTTSPSTPGCSVVLPSLASCTANPVAAGCSAVLPSLANCVATPTLSGCSVVLPSLASCVATPTLGGCSVVLPSLAACTVTPSLAGCSQVLPSVNQCTLNPSAAGCQTVFTQVQQQVVQPVSQAINATVNIINTVTTTASSPGALAPVFGSSPASSVPPSTGPVTTTIQADEKTGNKAVMTTSGDGQNDDKKEEKKDDKKETVSDKNTGAKKDEVAKKTYCN